MPSKQIAYIGLGSNLGDSVSQLVSALCAISELADTQVLKASSFYQSKPMGPQDQPVYVNAVARISTALAPHELLAALQKIEHYHGRVREGERWGPRTLDLDILLYGDESVKTPDLTIPHIGMAEREFVLVPLFEIASEMIMPDGSPLALWVSRCSLEGLRRLASINEQAAH
ncbi:2-amino-4-hydroxy-6-hydroxymethyldihydropteridine diphosphokinase [Alteromonas lipolytica]|uniref:2-amino-4-hydroxy-6-hydroxymethyldihydropteridine pyrophosphokinase n=1 Tax=Alteromonas lipolytica TaxID=1856405 RepID=A0A1E8FJN1_9ALTE|nr:2-amino-4-hydroxy-6-hydroxymethyldihydropteridine diphosphokinase [Alteromonas lipolytica]OFI36132.1 2-amino-4-hydroxy-6-hydroxymethyldihydropteridine diphosphokinase [Alteromonas lipolytica]GGF86197.1 2-amino-4-hydroxy-6-hydroxymethyldihydropteridine diphosphokinase [Alteromonas lipolytica]